MEALKNTWVKLTPTQALENSWRLERKFFETTYRLVYVTGLSTFEKSAWYSIYSVSVKTVIALLIWSELWNLISDTNSLDGFVANINVTLIQLIEVYRYLNMVSNKDLYKKLAQSMQSPYFDISTNERKKLVEYWTSENKKYLKLLFTLGVCTLSVWCIYPLIDGVKYNLIIAMRLPYEYRNPTLYPPTYIIVLIAFNHVGLFVISNDIIMQSHLIHLICQYAVLANCFENILIDCLPRGIQQKNFVANDRFKMKYLRRFNKYIIQHKLILKNSMELRSSLRLPMLCQLTFSGMLICFAAYQVTLTVKLSITKFLASLLYLSYNVFGLFIFCRWCDEIKIQSENISNAVYCSNWESGVALLSGVRSRIMIVIARAQKPLVLSAGGFFDLSLVTFTTLMKTSYSVLTVLLRFQD